MEPADRMGVNRSRYESPTGGPRPSTYMVEVLMIQPHSAGFLRRSSQQMLRPVIDAVFAGQLLVWPGKMPDLLACKNEPALCPALGGQRVQAATHC
eukprot:scaffold125542_cov17-Prasinocladus_malaysianus.AAC.2